MKVIIIGCNQAGAELAAQLSEQGHDVTILDRTSANFNLLPPFFKGVALLIGEAIEDTLEQVGIKDVQALLALTNDDNYNLLVSQLAKIQFNVPQTICCLSDPEKQQLYQRLGLEVISPTSLLIQEITQKLTL